MSESNLYPIQAEDVSKAVKVLKNAFEGDPLWSKVFNDDPHPEQSLTSFFTIPILYGLVFGKVYAPSKEIEGVAIWVPGKKSYMTMLRLIRCKALSHGIKIGRSTMKNMSVFSKKVEPDRKKRMKGKEYTYLTAIGVDPSFQGKGYGTLLINNIKEESDQLGHDLYLETESEENVTFYEKRGFHMLQKVHLEKLGVPIWQMLRPPSNR